MVLCAFHDLLEHLLGVHGLAFHSSLKYSWRHRKNASAHVVTDKSLLFGLKQNGAQGKFVQRRRNVALEGGGVFHKDGQNRGDRHNPIRQKRSQKELIH